MDLRDASASKNPEHPTVDPSGGSSPFINWPNFNNAGNPNIRRPLGGGQRFNSSSETFIYESINEEAAPR